MHGYYVGMVPSKMRFPFFFSLALQSGMMSSGRSRHFNAIAGVQMILLFLLSNGFSLPTRASSLANFTASFGSFSALVLNGSSSSFNTSDPSNEVGQMVYVAHTDTLFITDVKFHCLHAFSTFSGPSWSLARSSTIWAGRCSAIGQPPVVASSPTTRSQVTFNVPYGLAAVYPSGATAAQRLRLEHKPFALLIASGGAHVVQIVRLSPGDGSAQLVVGHPNVNVGPADGSGTDVRINYPTYLTDMLDGGGYAVGLYFGNCIAYFRPVAVNYYSVAAFQNVSVVTFAGKCGSEAPSSKPPDGTPAVNQSIFINPPSAAVHPEGSVMYVNDQGQNRLVKITPLYPAFARRSYTMLTSATASHIMFTRSDPTVLVIVTSGRRMDVLDVNSMTRNVLGDVVTTTATGRTSVLLPSGRLLLSMGGSDVVLHHGCCLQSWVPRLVFTEGVLAVAPTVMWSANVSDAAVPPAQVTSLSQLAFVSQEDAIYATSGSKLMKMGDVRAMALTGQWIQAADFAGNFPLKMPPSDVWVPIRRSGVSWSSAHSLAAMCPSAASPRERLLHICRPFALMVADKAAGSIWIVPLHGPTEGTARALVLKGESNSTGNRSAATFDPDGVVNHFTSPSFIADMLTDGALAVPLGTSHCVVILQSVNASYVDDESFGRATIRLFAGACSMKGSQSAAASPSAQPAYNTSIFNFPTAISVDPSATVMFVNDAGNNRLVKISPLFPPHSRIMTMVAPIGRDSGHMLYHPRESSSLLLVSTRGIDVVNLDLWNATSVFWTASSTRNFQALLWLPALGQLLLTAMSIPTISQVCCFYSVENDQVERRVRRLDYASRTLSPLTLLATPASPFNIVDAVAVGPLIAQLVFIPSVDIPSLSSGSRGTLFLSDFVSGVIRRAPNCRTDHATVLPTEIFAGAIAGGLPQALHQPRQQALFDGPLGLAPVCPSASSARERLRTICRPFALMLTTYQSNSVYLINLDDRNPDVLLLGSDAAVSPAINQPSYVTDMLDGSFLVPFAGSHCVAKISSKAAEYWDYSSFGSEVQFSVFAGRCGQAGNSSTVASIVVAADVPLFNRPVAVGVHPHRTAAYVTDLINARIVKVFSSTPATLATSATGRQAVVFMRSISDPHFVTFVPSLPSTMLLSVFGTTSARTFFYLQGVEPVSHEAREAEELEPWGGNYTHSRHILPLSSGSVLISRGKQQATTDHQSLIYIACCVPPWQPQRTRSFTISESLGLSANSTSVFNASLVRSKSVSVVSPLPKTAAYGQMVYVAANDALYITETSSHVVSMVSPLLNGRVAEWSRLTFVDYVGVRGSAFRSETVSVEPTSIFSAQLLAPTGLAPVCPSVASPTQRLRLECRPFGLLVASSLGNVVHFVSFDGVVRIISGAPFTGNNTLRSLKDASAARYSEPGHILDMLLGSFLVTDGAAHCLVELVPRQPYETPVEFSGLDAVPFAGLCGTPGSDTSTNASSASLHLPVATAVDPWQRALYVTDTGNRRIARIAPLRPALQRMIATLPFEGSGSIVLMGGALTYHPLEPSTLLTVASATAVAEVLAVDLQLSVDSSAGLFNNWMPPILSNSRPFPASGFRARARWAVTAGSLVVDRVLILPSGGVLYGGRSTANNSIAKLAYDCCLPGWVINDTSAVYFAAPVIPVGAGFKAATGVAFGQLVVLSRRSVQRLAVTDPIADVVRLYDVGPRFVHPSGVIGLPGGVPAPRIVTALSAARFRRPRAMVALCPSFATPRQRWRSECEAFSLLISSANASLYLTSFSPRGDSTTTDWNGQMVRRVVGDDAPASGTEANHSAFDIVHLADLLDGSFVFASTGGCIIRVASLNAVYWDDQSFGNVTFELYGGTCGDPKGILFDVQATCADYLGRALYATTRMGQLIRIRTSEPRTILVLRDGLPVMSQILLHPVEPETLLFASYASGDVIAANTSLLTFWKGTGGRGEEPPPEIPLRSWTSQPNATSFAIVPDGRLFISVSSLEGGSAEFSMIERLPSWKLGDTIYNSGPISPRRRLVVADGAGHSVTQAAATSPQLFFNAFDNVLYRPDPARHVIGRVSLGGPSLVVFREDLFAGQYFEQLSEFTVKTTTRHAARFSSPSGIVPICASDATPRQRVRLDCEPFGLLTSSANAGVLHAISLNSLVDEARVVAGRIDNGGPHVDGAGDQARFDEPHYLVDMLDGTFLLLVRQSCCVVVVRSINERYGDWSSVGNVTIATLRGSCGNCARHGRSVIWSCSAAAISPHRDALYLVFDPKVEDSTTIARLTGGPPSWARTYFMRTTPSFDASAMVFHPLESETLLILQVAVANSSVKITALNVSDEGEPEALRHWAELPSAVRSLVWTPSGTIILPDGTSAIFTDCCFKPWWNWSSTGLDLSAAPLLPISVPTTDPPLSSSEFAGMAFDGFSSALYVCDATAHVVIRHETTVWDKPGMASPPGPIVRWVVVLGTPGVVLQPPTAYTRTQASAARLHSPSGIATVCPSAATPRDRWRLACKPFGLLVSSVAGRVIHLVTIGLNIDTARIVVGAAGIIPVVDAEDSGGDTARLYDPGDLSDALDGGGFLVADGRSGTVRHLRPVNATYDSDESFGVVMVRNFAGAAGAITVSDGSIAYKRAVFRSPIAARMSLFGSICFVLDVKATGSVLKKIQPVWPPAARLVFTIQLALGATASFAFHPVFPSTLVVSGSSLVAHGPSMITIDCRSRSAALRPVVFEPSGTADSSGTATTSRSTMFLPSGRMMLSFNVSNSRAQSPLKTDCCFPSWDVPSGSPLVQQGGDPTGSSSRQRLFFDVPAAVHPFVEFDPSTEDPLVSYLPSLGQLVYDATGDVIYMPSVHMHCILVFPAVERAAPERSLLDAPMAYAGLPGRRLTAATLATDTVATFSFPVGMVAVCASSMTSSARLHLACKPFALLISSFTGHVIHLVSLQQTPSDGLLHHIVAGKIDEIGVLDGVGALARLGSPSFAADLLDGTFAFADVLTHSIVRLSSASNTSAYNSMDAFGDAADVRVLVGSRGGGRTASPESVDGSSALSRCLLEPSGVVVARRESTNDSVMFVSETQGVVWKVAPLFPAQRRRVWLVQFRFQDVAMAPAFAAQDASSNRGPTGYSLAFHALEPDTLFISGVPDGSIFAVDVGIDLDSNRWTGLDWSNRSRLWATVATRASHMIFLPSGRVLVGLTSDFADVPPTLLHDCCFLSWNVVDYLPTESTSVVPNTTVLSVTAQVTPMPPVTVSPIPSEPAVSVLNGTATNRASNEQAPAVAVAVVVSSVSAALGPGSASGAFRLIALSLLIQCPDAYSLTPPSRLENPLELLIGAAPPAAPEVQMTASSNATGDEQPAPSGFVRSLALHRGAVVVQLAIFLPTLVALLCAGYSIQYRFTRPEEDVAIARRLPSWRVPFFVARFPSAAVAASQMTIFSALSSAMVMVQFAALSAVPAVDIALASCVMLVCVALVVYILVMTTSKRRFRARHAEQTDFGPELPTWLQRALTGGRIWVPGLNPRTGELSAFHCPHRAIYCDFQYHRTWWLAVDLGATTIVTMLCRVRSSITLVCNTMVWSVVAVNVVLLGALIILRPHAGAINIGQAIVAQLLALVSSGLLIGGEPFEGVSDAVAQAALAVAAARLIFDVMVFVLENRSAVRKAVSRSVNFLLERRAKGRKATDVTLSVAAPSLEPFDDGSDVDWNDEDAVRRRTCRTPADAPEVSPPQLRGKRNLTLALRREAAIVVDDAEGNALLDMFLSTSGLPGQAPSRHEPHTLMPRDDDVKPSLRSDPIMDTFLSELLALSAGNEVNSTLPGTTDTRSNPLLNLAPPISSAVLEEHAPDPLEEFF